MAKVITAPDNWTDTAHYFKIFLAGAIDTGAAVNWQAEVIARLEDEPELSLLNPRRFAFTSEKLDEQIIWELDALEAADLILMWLPVNAKAPVSMLEAGLYMRDPKLIIGAEPGFYRLRNLEHTAHRYEKTVVPNLDTLIKIALRRKRFIHDSALPYDL